MTNAIRVHQPGGIEALKFEAIKIPEISPRDALIKHVAIGVNFLDTYYRRGLYPWPSNSPIILGAEAAGIVRKVGNKVAHVQPGDRVAYTLPLGAYCEERVIDASNLVLLPDNVSAQVGAASMLKGLTVHYLFNRTFKLKKEHTILFHAAAGGVGLIAGQWATHVGATIIGTVSSKEKEKLAAKNGYTHVINYREENFVEKVAEITDEVGVDIVYDSVGKDTYPDSLSCLKRLGTWVSFGQSSGFIENFDLKHLAQRGSLTAIRPGLYDYIKTRKELEAGAQELFALIERKAIKIEINQNFILENVGDAHQQLENRMTTGSTILIP